VLGEQVPEYPLYARCEGCDGQIVAVDSEAEWADLAQARKHHPGLVWPVPALEGLAALEDCLEALRDGAEDEVDFVELTDAELNRAAAVVVVYHFHNGASRELQIYWRLLARELEGRAER